MLSLHDHLTNQMCNRLETTCIGLGLVRLLQDAKRFDEAREVLHALENDFRGDTEKSETNPRLAEGISEAASCLPASATTTEVAELATQPSSVA